MFQLSLGLRKMCFIDLARHTVAGGCFVMHAAFDTVCYTVKLWQSCVSSACCSLLSFVCCLVLQDTEFLALKSLYGADHLLCVGRVSLRASMSPLRMVLPCQLAQRS